MADEGAATLAVLDTTGLDGCRGKDGERRREGDRDGCREGEGRREGDETTLGEGDEDDDDVENILESTTGTVTAALGILLTSLLIRVMEMGSVSVRVRVLTLLRGALFSTSASLSNSLSSSSSRNVQSMSLCCRKYINII